MTLQYEAVDGRGLTQKVYATPDGGPDLLGRYDPETGAPPFPPQCLETQAQVR